VTSLPGPHGSGDLGSSASRFLEFLESAAQGWWQMLPIGPPGYGRSPYSAQSAFAGSPMLVALEPLVNAGLLDRSAAANARPKAAARVDFERMSAGRDAHLHAAFDAFEALPKAARRGLERFRHDNDAWLDDFCLFRALKHAHGGGAWTGWPAPVRARQAHALKDARAALRREIAYEEFVQYQFAEQWSSLREQARSRGIGLIGDVPLYVAHDSADVWSRPHLFQLASDGMPSKVAGVPPDYFSKTGQRWGNPLYAWKRHEEEGFAWWTQRLRSALGRFDALRMDHFIGFCRYWEVLASSPTAANGRWRRGPGSRLFRAVRRGVGGGSRLPLIAEDLGVTGPDVIALRDRWSLPGTKVLQFAFGDDPSAQSFLPHNFRRRAVVYTGTHDNDTTVGWYQAATSDGSRAAEALERERRAALRYVGGLDGEGIHWRFLRAAAASVANVAIFPLQDVLGLGSSARMNLPGTTDGNWAWRADASALTASLSGRLAALTRTYGRAAVAPAP
jgi:4-alpha-glucanotransferase